MDVKPKVRKGKMEENVEIARRINAIRGEQTQAEFAERLGVTQPMVSAWEMGREVPSSAFCLRLGNMASYPDNLEFWRAAGLSQEKVLSAAERILREGDKVPARGAITSVPCVRWARRGLQKIDRHIDLPTEFVPNPLSTWALVIDEDAANPRIRCGDVLVYDRSANDAKDLSSFWNEIVLANVDPQIPYVQDNYRKWGGVYVGRLECKPDVNSSRAFGYSSMWYAVLTVFNDSEREPPVDQKEMRLGECSYPLTAEWSFSLPGEPLKPVQVNGFEEKNRNEALSRIQLYEAAQILGILVAWFTAPAKAAKK